MKKKNTNQFQCNFLCGIDFIRNVLVVQSNQLMIEVSACKLKSLFTDHCGHGARQQTRP